MDGMHDLNGRVVVPVPVPEEAPLCRHNELRERERSGLKGRRREGGVPAIHRRSRLRGIHPSRADKTSRRGIGSPSGLIRIAVGRASTRHSASTTTVFGDDDDTIFSTMCLYFLHASTTQSIFLSESELALNPSKVNAWNDIQRTARLIPNEKAVDCCLTKDTTRIRANTHTHTHTNTIVNDSNRFLTTIKGTLI
ncbi:hypothetical protein C4D60_Mb11t21930 [Musa balbisiana]|uniref:Uncharacterized protein n=1 Tax=Musa balbisiana TaxID=52838 RepID=A0A4V4H5P5_MUSBA|nr:hypothetical protein C4D60_Mb11t21930 [Musa balbisiana]